MGLLLLALPLAVAVWAFGAVAGKRERSNADQRLVQAINAADRSYAAVSRPSQKAAEQIARNRRVQRAFVRNDRRALQKLQRVYATAGVLLLPGKAPAPPMLGQDDVTMRGKLVGRVLAGNLDQSAARQLARRANEPPGRVGFLVNEHLITGAGAIAAPSWPKFGKASDLSSFRVVAVPIPGRDRSAGTSTRCTRRSGGRPRPSTAPGKSWTSA